MISSNRFPIWFSLSLQQIPYEKPPDQDTEKLSYQHRLTAQQDNDFKWLGVKLYKKPQSVFRIWSQNLNGIDCSHNMSSFSESLQSLSQYEVQHFGFTETNVNASNVYFRDTLEHITQQVLPASWIAMSNTHTDNITEPRQFGGTLSLAHGPLAARVAKCGNDDYGRFSWIQFFGKKIICVFVMFITLFHILVAQHTTLRYGFNNAQLCSKIILMIIQMIIYCLRCQRW